MDINEIKIGDILDAYVEGCDTQRVMVIDKTRHYVFGVNKYNRVVYINAEYEIEKVITNIDDL